jgi:hypothetical protein
MNDSESEKWGWQEQYGWIVIDLDIACNNSGKHNFRYIARCENWKVLKVETLETRPPKFTYADKYLASLPPQESRRQASWLKAYQSRAGFQKIRSKLRQEVIQKLHATYMQEMNEQSQWDKSALRSTKLRRSKIMHCWQCKRDLDKLLNPICHQCAWYICDACGACKCGSPFM